MARDALGPGGGLAVAGVPVSPARVLRETTGPTSLILGAVADGEYLKRVGSTVVGGTPPGGGGTAYKDLMPGAALFPDGSTGNFGAGLVRVQGTESNPKKHLLALNYIGTGTEPIHSWWQFHIPGDYASGGILLISWILSGTSLAVKWQARVGAVTAGDADTPLEHAQAAAATVTTNVNTTEANRLTQSSITLTMDSAAADDLINLTLLRDPADAADTSTVTAQVLGCRFAYTKS